MHIWDNEQVLSTGLLPPGCTKLIYPAMSRDRLALCAVDLRDDETAVIGSLVETLTYPPKRLFGAPAGVGLHFPRFAPSGQALAVIETQQGRDLDPRKEHKGELVVYTHNDGTWIKRDTKIPCLVAPFDWGPNDGSLIHQDPERRLVLTRLDDPDYPAEIAREAKLPVTSPSGEAAAYYHRHQVMYAHPEEGIRTLNVDRAVMSLSWGLDEEELLIALATRFFETEVRVWNIRTNEMNPIFKTVSIDYAALMAVPD
ncbi:MAG: hypothetical protein Alpg2KO_20880 [Alphaproteobacteria bacterium]